MNFSEFFELGNIIKNNREDYRYNEEWDAIQYLIEIFKNTCKPYKPMYVKFFELYLQCPEYKLNFGPDAETSVSKISNHCYQLSENKKGRQENFLALVLLFLWKNSNKEFLSFLNKIKSEGDFISNFLNDDNARLAHSKRGIMKRDYVERRLTPNILDWEIANRRISAARDKLLGNPSENISLSFTKLFIDSLPEEILYLPNLKEIFLSNTLFRNLKQFSNLRGLQVLDCSYNDIKSINDIIVDDLEKIMCGVTNIAEINILAKASKLHSLYCGSTYINDLTSLSNCKELKLICCEDTEIKSLSGLEHCKKLTYIDCSDTNVTNLHDICDLQNLNEIVLNGCKIDDSLKDLVKIPTLKRIIFYKGEAKNVPEFTLSRESNDNCLHRLRDFFAQN